MRIIFCVLSVLQCLVASGVNITMGNGSQTVSCGATHNFYDPGGSGGSYASSLDYTLTISAGSSSCISVSFTSFDTESCCDYLSIYDGTGTSGTLLGSFGGTTIPPNITSTSGSITFVFHSDGSIVGAGWAATISCTACPPPPAYYTMNNTNEALTCPPTYTLFYDNGGPSGNYTSSQNLTKTFSVPAGYCLQITFDSFFDTESCCDKLKIFDGPNGASPLIGTYAGSTSPGIIIPSGTSVTFSFTSDGSVVKSGWSATITCLAACSGTPAGGTAVNTAGNCPPTGSVAMSVSGGGTGCGITYQWQSAPASTGPWSNVAGATSSTLMVAAGTTYYRRLTNCGIQTGTSTVVQGSTYTVTVPCSLSTYTAATTTYSFESFAGTVLPTTDDVLFSTIVNFGFSFCYGGSQYWGGYVASNGAFVFDAVPCYPNISTSTYAAGGVGTGYTIPSAAPVNSTSIPRNAVLGPWHDIDPSVGGTIQYYTTGTAPNRKFVVSFETIPMFGCNAKKFTGQIKLFETSNAIEIHVGNKPLCASWDNGSAVLGLHNFDGTIYVPPVNATAHNVPTQWTMSNKAYRFQSPCAVNSGACAILPIGFKNFYGEQENGVNKLYWETAVESNMKDFTIERSTDAINFTTIGHMLPNNEPSKYTFNDDTFRPGIVNYYRITATDFSGETSSTFIYPISSTILDLTVSEVFPNPTTFDFNISIISKAQINIAVNVRDTYGKLIKSSNHDCAVGVNTINISSPEAPGFYVVEVVDGDKVVSQQKLVIIR